jgi:hypothetical protein
MYMGYICRFAVLEIKGWVVDQVVELLTQHEQGPGFNFWKEGRKEGRERGREERKERITDLAGYGGTYLYFQHVGGGGRRIVSSRLTWLHNEFQASQERKRKGEEKKPLTDLF